MSQFSRFKKPLFLVLMVTFLVFWIRDNSTSTQVGGGRPDVNEALKRSHSKSVLRYPPSLLNRYVYGNGRGDAQGDSTENMSWWTRLFYRLFNWHSEPKIVIILAANEGGGVLKWKNEQEWAIERLSINNKKAYAKKHGYGLTIKDQTVAKRYSHEFREGWQKVDILRQAMREFSNAEWFWWLDLDTLIMEPQFSLEDHIFNRLNNITDRTLQDFNPLNIPIDIPYVDYKEEVNLLITQDCGGFNLGSFLIKNTEWSHMLLELWWEPALYEQKHMFWEHKEQDALEALYANQGWIRSRVGFLPLRSINSFPPGACSEFQGDKRFFYDDKENDFVVNMAGCNFGRDCWDEMQHYTRLLEDKNRQWFSRLFH
ncbi:MNN10 (YDR245W) [Zygosaccharomyces parabailii]|nr:MNN10 (YDR245W) [Zygosaccharomyces parabailii]